jgi:hypothetical protein
VSSNLTASKQPCVFFVLFLLERAGFLVGRARVVDRGVCTRARRQPSLAQHRKEGKCVLCARARSRLLLPRSVGCCRRALVTDGHRRRNERDASSPLLLRRQRIPSSQHRTGIVCVHRSTEILPNTLLCRSRNAPKRTQIHTQIHTRTHINTCSLSLFQARTRDVHGYRRKREVGLVDRQRVTAAGRHRCVCVCVSRQRERGRCTREVARCGADRLLALESRRERE